MQLTPVTLPSLPVRAMSPFPRLQPTDFPLGRILEFPVSQRTAPEPELPGALTYGSPENLILEATHVLERIVRLAHSLSKDQILDVLGDLIVLETQRLDPLQRFVEQRRSFLSDLSAKQMRKRRRRQKRVKQDLSA